LAQPEPEPEPLDPVLPDPIPLPEFEPVPPPQIELEPLPEPELLEPIVEQPIIEFFEPLPEPVPVEPLPIEPEPVLDPILEPAPLAEPELEIEIFDPLPEPLEEVTEEPIVEDPIPEDVPATPGVLEAEPLPEILEPEPLPPEIVIEPEPEPEPEPLPEPTPLEPTPVEPEIIPTAPTILASPEAPDTREEERRAVPQEQSDPFIDLLKRDRDSTQPTSPPRSLSGPATGGGNQGPVGSINAPPGGGTSRGGGSSGAGNWTLAPQPTGPSKAYEGLNLDIRCREEGRTHADCPEYIRRNRGRAADGSESFDGFAGRGADRGDRIEDSRSIPSRSDLGLQIGDNSINGGGPSTGPLDFQDQNFDREFLGKELYQFGKERGDLDDIFAPIDPVDTPPDWTLPAPPTESSNDSTDTDWLLKTLPE